jgi:hypothetical protein
MTPTVKFSPPITATKKKLLHDIQTFYFFIFCEKAKGNFFREHQKAVISEFYYFLARNALL